MRANLVRERLSILRAGEEVLDSLTYGIAFLTDEGSLVYLNEAAKAILRQEDGLVVRSNRVHAVECATQATLENAVRQAARLEASQGWPRPVAVPRDSMRRPYQLLIAPLRGRLAQFTAMAHPTIVLFLIDPEMQPAAIPELMQKFHGLTKKEAAIAVKLAEGKAVNQVADELGMRYETARTHLRRIYEKTATSRQTELVGLLHLVPKLKPRR